MQLKRNNVEKSWGALQKKTFRYVVTPQKTGYLESLSLRLKVIFVTKGEMSSKDFKRKLREGAFILNGKAIKSANYSIGMYETIEDREQGEAYQIIVEKSYLLKIIKVTNPKSYYFVEKVNGTKFCKVLGGKIFNIAAKKGDLIVVDSKKNCIVYKEETEPAKIFYKKKPRTILLPK